MSRVRLRGGAVFFYLWGNLIGLDMRSLCPAWTALTERTFERAAVRRVLEKEELPTPVH